MKEALERIIELVGKFDPNSLNLNDRAIVEQIEFVATMGLEETAPAQRVTCPSGAECPAGVCVGCEQ